jgi:predicted nucleotidyltransferase
MIAPSSRAGKLLGVSVDVLTPKNLPDKFRGLVLAEAVPV